MTSVQRALKRGLVALSALALAACGGTAGAQGATTLDFSYLYGPDHHIRINVLDPLAEELSETTDGELGLNIEAGGVLADATTFYDYISSGSLDAGWSLQSYTPGVFPNSEFLDLPFMFTSAVEATNVFWDIADEYPEVLEDYSDVKLLAVFSHDVGELFSTDRPILSADDVKGLTVRTTGPKLSAAIKALGGTPVDMPGNEIYDALDRGVVDAYMIASTGPGVLGLSELTSHVTDLGIFVGPQYLAMSQKAYDQLGKSQQEAIDAVAGRELSLRLAEDFDKQSAAAKAAYKNDGIEVTEPDVGEFREKVEPIVQLWIDEREAAGVPGQEIIDRVRELTEQY